MDRRTFLARPLALALARPGPMFWERKRQPKTRLILLGTGGGPRPRASNSAPAQVIVVGDTAYVVDCGDGVARQLVLAGVPLAAIRHVFITHHHPDHNADYGNLLLLAWTAGLRTRVDTWGPEPLAAMTRLFFEMNLYDMTTRIADEGRAPLVPLVHVHEVNRSGSVMRDEHVTVTAAVSASPRGAGARVSLRCRGPFNRHLGGYSGRGRADHVGPRRRRARSRGDVWAGHRSSRGPGSTGGDAGTTPPSEPYAG